MTTHSPSPLGGLLDRLLGAALATTLALGLSSTAAAEEPAKTPAVETVQPADEAPEATEAAAEAPAPPVFTEAFLQDAATIEEGREHWGELCVHCHGSKAYPGKAPKLKPARYSPDFVYDRITNGFRKMPSWKDDFTREERMALVAWVLSREFTP